MRLWSRLIPEIRRLDETARRAALERAREEPLDAFELIGMAGAVLLVTAVTRQTAHDLALATRFLGVLANFIVAIPLLAITLGPFHLRRLRRGVRKQAASSDPAP